MHPACHGSWLSARRGSRCGSSCSPFCGCWLLARRGPHTHVVNVYMLPEIRKPRLKTDSKFAVTALSEGFSPFVVLTLRLESLPYQRADTRHSRFLVFCVTRLTTRLNTDSEVAVTALSEGFSPLAVLTLRLESLPYQRADTRLVVFISFIGASGDFFVVAFFEA